MFSFRLKKQTSQNVADTTFKKESKHWVISTKKVNFTRAAEATKLTWRKISMFWAAITTEEYKKKIIRQKINQQLKQRTKEMREKTNRPHRNQKKSFQQRLPEMKKFPVNWSERQVIANDADIATDEVDNTHSKQESENTPQRNNSEK